MSQRINVSTLHISGLDGLRGIAILSVLFHHLMIIDITADSPLRTFSGGFLGVDLFFVISGFLITWLALAEFKLTGSINVRHFYERRVLRLIPALVFFLLVQILCAAFSGQLREYFPTVLATLFYYLNWKAYFTLDVATGFGHLWSLSVEEQFYIVWPLFLLLLLRTSRPWLVVTNLVMIAIVIHVYRNDLWHETGNWFHLYLRTDLRLDAFVLGGNLLEWIDTWVVIAIALAMTALLTEFSWRVVERPFNRLRTRFSHRADHD